MENYTIYSVGGDMGTISSVTICDHICIVIYGRERGEKGGRLVF
jgi:hypothetical protein